MAQSIVSESHNDECILLSIPVSLFDQCLSYLASVELKTTFNLCRDIRYYLQDPKFWSDFKVVFEVRKITQEDIALSSIEPRTPQNDIRDTLRNHVSDPHTNDDAFDSHNISQSTDALIAQLLSGIIPNFHETSDMKADKHNIVSKSIFHRLYEIDFILKQVRIYQVGVIHTFIWRELIQYFGCWMINCHLMYSHSFDFLSMFYERGLFREHPAFMDETALNELQILKSFYDFSIQQPPLLSLLQYAHKNVVSLNINARYYVLTDRIQHEYYAKYNDGLMPDNVDGMSNSFTHNMQEIMNEEVELYCWNASKYNLNELQQMSTLFENAQTQLLVNLLHFKWDRLQHVHVEGANIFDLVHYISDGSTGNIYISDAINRKCVHKIKIFDLECCDAFWASNWFYHMIEDKIFDDLVMLRLFNTVWNTEHRIKLPPKLEFLRITHKNRRFESGDEEEESSDGEEDNDVEEEESNVLQSVGDVLAEYQDFVPNKKGNSWTPPVLEEDEKTQTECLDPGKAQLKHHSYWKTCELMARCDGFDDPNKATMARTRVKKPLNGNHLLNLDFSLCVALTEMVVDFVSLDVFYPLFVQCYDIAEMRRFVRHGTDDMDALFAKYRRKVDMDMGDILPSLKRIVIVGYSLDKKKLKLFLCICRPWIVRKNIRIYLPQIDVTLINDLCLKHLIGAGNDGYPIPMENDEDEELDHDLATYMKEDSKMNNTVDGMHAVIAVIGIDDTENKTTQKVKVKKRRYETYRFKWSDWSNYLFAERLSVQRWSQSDNYRLFGRCVNWKMWWFRDFQSRCEPYQNWAFM
eukprot:570229_1